MKMSDYSVNILHLYPDLLNLYGDMGNISALTKRLTDRNISANVITLTELAPLPDLNDIDIIFLGGGSDHEIEVVCNALMNNKTELKDFVEADGVMVALCSGYPIIGKSYISGDKTLDGLGIVDITTTKSKKRLISDVIIESNLVPMKIVGFENHPSCTHIGDYKPLGKVLYGKGNTDDGTFEGIVYKNLLGTYLHGPLFPKNPMLCDYVLTKALKKKYPDFTELSPLDDQLEIKANQYIIERLK